MKNDFERRASIVVLR